MSTSVSTSTVNEDGDRPVVGRAIVADLLERGALLGLYAWLVYRVAVGDPGPVGFLFLVSEGLVVLLLLVRRATTTISLRPGDWLLAFGAAATPLLVRPDTSAAIVPMMLAAVLILMGMIIQIHAKVVLGRSFGGVPAHRGLKLSGPYRFVRHPMYAGYLISHLGFLLASATVWNLAVYVACYSLQVPRLLAEERLLKQDPMYAEYASVVRFRLIPGVF